MLSISALRNLKKHYAYTLQFVRRRLNRQSTEKDIFTSVLEQDDIDETHLVSLAQAMVIAGADTVSVAITSAIYFLCASPDCLAKLRDEVRALTYEQLDGVELPQLRYLNAVTEETSKNNLNTYLQVSCDLIS